MEWVANILHTTSEHGVSSITTADAYTSAASSRLNWRPSRCKWARPFGRKTKSGLCAFAITFQTESTILYAKIRVFFTLSRNMVYPALLPLMRTPQLPVIDWTDAPADLNGLILFSDRWNLVPARVPLHFKRSLQTFQRRVVPSSSRSRSKKSFPYLSVNMV